MATDIQLDAIDGTFVVVDGRVLKATASDFMLDSLERRKSAERSPAKLRRALVHDEGDGLTINFAGDYPGGVTINDVKALNSGRAGLHLQDVVEISAFKPSGHRRAGGENSVTGQEGLVLRGTVLIEPGSAAPSTGDDREPRSERAFDDREPVSLQRMLAELHAEIARLHGRVTELEARH
jgi:hypothetical protein